jgi:hypothetical protein
LGHMIRLSNVIGTAFLYVLHIYIYSI